MQEAFLHFIWKNSLFENTEYPASNKEKIKILNTGEHNCNSGPDFTHAKILIDNTKWAGNVEIHKNASDWNNHNHHKNDAYNNVILHVVEKDDCKCFTNSGRLIPTIKLKYPESIYKKFNKLVNSFELISCSSELSSLNHSLISFWLSSLAIERLQSKINVVKELLKLTKNSWEDAFYIHLLKSYGLKVNSVPFEMLARVTPLKILEKHSSSLFQLEAILFGQAGMLNTRPVDNYHSKLKKEYQYLKTKYGLKPLEQHIWKFMRLRPSNFPTIRISQFCNLIHISEHLFSKTMECENVDELIKLYSFKVSEYWKSHYTFGKISGIQNKSIGKSSVHLLIINTIIPFMFVYASIKSIPELKERAVRLLEDLPAENNSVVRRWKELGIIPRHTADSQAILQLTIEYCKSKKCLDCQIGNLLLKRNEHETRES
ncbi:MAG: DUF2851 family protein [Bacteroidales bacterium]|nr:DUF2851 family protein [Bacteroidales bacterium]